MTYQNLYHSEGADKKTIESGGELENNGTITNASGGLIDLESGSEIDVANGVTVKFKNEDDFTFETFAAEPATQLPGGGAATGTTGDENLLLTPKNVFRYHILGAGQTIISPTKASGGIDIGLDQADNEGCEITQGITANDKHAFVIGTSAAFYAKAKFSIADVSGTDDCAFGFRKAEAFQANIDDYDEMAALNVISGNITVETILNNAATSSTDTTDDWADGETHTLEVYVSAAGVVTFKIDGAAPTTTATFTFDTSEVVVPFLYFLNASDLAGAVVLQEWEVGYQ